MDETTKRLLDLVVLPRRLVGLSDHLRRIQADEQGTADAGGASALSEWHRGRADA